METSMAEQKDMGQATESYSLFTQIFKWGSIAAAITTATVVMIIASRAA
jgi:hypothetical protein